MSSNFDPNKISDYSNQYDDFLDEAAGIDRVNQNDEEGKKPSPKSMYGFRNDSESEDEENDSGQQAYMMFDFRRGSERWPANATLLSPTDASSWITEERERLNTLIAKKAQAAVDKKAGPDKKSGGAGAELSDDESWLKGFVADGKTTNPMDGYGGGNNIYSGGGYYDDSSSSSSEENEEKDLAYAIDSIEIEDDDYDKTDQEKQDIDKDARDKRIADAESKLKAPSPEGAIFETLSDGSSALHIQAGWRLSLDLRDLEKGGDETKNKREAAEKKEQERKEKLEAKRKRRREKAAKGGVGGFYWGGIMRNNNAGTNTNTNTSTNNTTSKTGNAYHNDYQFTSKIPEFTITLDIQTSSTVPIPHAGMSLIHTSLLRAEDTHGSTKLIQTNGETLINCDGGVGHLGTFGDVGKTRVIPGKWHRIVIAIKCASSDKDKGELRTWIDAEPCCVLRSDEIKRGGRFELNPTNLYLFSSNDVSMMPGKVLLRTVKVEEGFATDATVLANRAKDKIYSVWNEEFEKKVDIQRAGLSLAGLFSKPRPIWSTPAFIGTFGDAFIEGTTFEGSSCLAWSYTVMNHTLQRTLTRQRRFYTGFSRDDFGVLSDTLHIISKSAIVFKEMARLIQNPRGTQLMSFLRKIKKFIGKINAGESMLFPCLVEDEELLLLLMRTRSERYYNLAVIASNPLTALKYHAVDASMSSPRIQYRTALVLNQIDKKSATCDVFWSAVFNLTSRCCGGNSSGDLKKFYGILLPFMTHKPLEETLVEVEVMASKELKHNSKDGDLDNSHDEAKSIADKHIVENADDKDFTNTEVNDDTVAPLLVPIPTPITPEPLIGPFRFPQRSSTAYVRCFFEALHFLLTTDPEKSLSIIKADQVLLAVQAELIDMICNDLSFVHPEDSDQRACEIAIRTFSDLAVELSEDFAKVIKEGKGGNSVQQAQRFLNLVPEAVRAKVVDIGAILEAIANQEEDLPPILYLDQGRPDVLDNTNNATKNTSQESAEMQFRDLLTWDMEPNTPDPGNIKALRKYDAVDMLLIKERAQTREEAVDALRQCDLMCVQLGNQSHCVKNSKFLIAALIEHVFVQVIQTPKPRVTPWMDPRAAKRAEEMKKRRAERALKEAKENVHRAKEFESFYKGGGNSNALRNLQTAQTELQEAQEKAREILGVDENGKPALSSTAAAAAVGAVEGIEKGRACEEALYQEDCYWDQPIHYDLQVELLLTLQRLMENFVAASMSIHATRAFDSVCMVVPGIITCVADAVLRRLAVDRPSPFTGILVGINTKDGRQLGFPGFGLGLGGFAAQVETMEVHTPELSVAATSVLDYFGSSDQKRLDTVFDWEQGFMLTPTRNLIKMLRHICRSLAFTTSKPHYLLVDGCPEHSELLKQFPEMKAYRDLALWWKYFLNPDVDVFPNTNVQDISTFDRMATQLNWSFSDDSYSYTVTSFNGNNTLSCCPDPKKVDPVTRKPRKIATHRYPSTATPGFYCHTKPMVKTEDDIIYCPNLPTFADKGEKKEDGIGKLKASTSGAGNVSTSNASTNSGGLSQRDSELLLSFMTVPYLRLPLTLTFFSSDDRVHKLQSSKLRGILDSVIFERGRHLCVADTGVMPALVPTQHKHLLSTSYGLLCNELHRTPETVLRSVQALLKGALALDTGEVCNVDEEDFNTGVQIILYATRLTSRVDNFVSFLIDTKTGRHPCLSGITLREVNINQKCLATLERGLDGIRKQLHDEVVPLLEDYLLKLDRAITDKVGDEKLLDRNSRLACDIHAHQLLMFRNLHYTDLNFEKVKTIISSFVFMTTRHTWNKASRKLGKLLIPETEIYEMLQVTRRKIVGWLHDQKQGMLDDVLQTTMQVSSSTTGSMYKIKDNLIRSNRWARIAGPGGRYAVSSTRKIDAKPSSDIADKGNYLKEDEDSFNGDDLELLPPPREVMTRSTSTLATVGVVADSTVLGVEMDLQIGQMTLRSKHLQALDSNLANHPDVKLIFGEATMQVSVLESAEHRQRYRLVGLNHELEYWGTRHTDCPPLMESYEREYDPAELAPHEGWIAKLFEPPRKSFFDGPQPPPMQFMMPMAVPENAEIVVLVGLHQVLRGTFKLVHVFRHLKGVQIFEVVSQGRQWWYSLHLSTVCQYSLKDLQPSYDDRVSPYPKWWVNGAGDPYPKGVGNYISNDLEISCSGQSVLIKRDPSDVRNISGGFETFVPERLLFGALPQSLLDSYLFWQDEALFPTSIFDGEDDEYGRSRLEQAKGYQRLRGYPKKNVKGCEETLLVVEFQCIGSWEAMASSAEASHDNNNRTDVVDVTQLPGRSVRVSRIPIKYARDDLTRRRKLCAYLETLQLISPKKEKAQGSKKVSSDTQNNTDKEQSNDSKFQVGSTVEYDADGTSKRWVASEVLKVHKGGKLYDIDTKGPLGCQARVPEMFLRVHQSIRQKQGREAVCKFDGLSDSEDEAWLDVEQDDSKGFQTKDDSKQKQKFSLTFEQLDRLGHCLSLVGNNLELCFTICRRLSSESRTISSIRDLSKAIAIEADNHHFKDEIEESHTIAMAEAQEACENTWDLLNILSAPRRSRLHSLLKTLVRVETVGHILAWTKRSSVLNITAGKGSKSDAFHSNYPWWAILSSSPLGQEFDALYGCPPINIIELPRLKLSFTVRGDHSGVERLYSMDHSNLFVCNERNAMVNAMIQGIPHSLVLSNIEGEMQILIPVLNPYRPNVQSNPFTTSIVLDRSDNKWRNALTSRYFMYPVHVSMSFMMTKGLHAAMYLLLLRLLHRDYNDVFRLTESIASDSAFSPEGEVLFDAFGNANDDCHPDAHACRLKISLASLESGRKFPWDVTLECAKYIVKYDRVTASCVIPVEEEYQLISNSEIIVTDDSHPLYDLNYTYFYTIVKNRRAALCVITSNSLGGQPNQRLQRAGCFHPPRAQTTNWPYFMDNTALGESYSRISKVSSADEWDEIFLHLTFPAMETKSSAGEQIIAPFAAQLALRQYEQYNDMKEDTADLQMVYESKLSILGWAYGVNKQKTNLDRSLLDVKDTEEHKSPPSLHEYERLQIVIFHVIWSASCVKSMPLIEQLSSSYPSVKFSSVRADCEGLQTLSRQHSVTSFPTLIAFRGKTEIGRVDGDRIIARLDALLKNNSTTRDGLIHDALTLQAKFEDRHGKEFSTISESAITSQDDSCDALFSSLGELQAELQKKDDEETEELVWVWDPDYAASNITVGGYGTCISYISDEFEQDLDNDDKLLASAKWQILTKNNTWETIDTAACIECERKYRMGLLFTEGRMVAMGKEKVYEITADAEHMKINGDEISGMNVVASTNSYQSHSFRRKGLRFVVKGDEKFTDKAQKSRDRYEAEWKAEMKRKSIEYKQFKGDTQGVRGTHGFMEESGKYTWSLKWCHEPGRHGEGDAVGICSELGEGFGPYRTPLLGTCGGVSIGLYANGALFYNDKEIARLIGPERSAEATMNSDSKTYMDEEDDDGMEKNMCMVQCGAGHPLIFEERENYYCDWCGKRHTYWICGLCNQDYCQTCYTKKLDELNNQKTDEDDNSDVDENDSDSDNKSNNSTHEDDSDSKESASDKNNEQKEKDEKKKLRIEDFLPVERTLEHKDLAPLFGKNSIVTMTLDTDCNGGSIRFEVDGETLVAEGSGESTLDNVFQRLSTTHIYPCICMIPADKEKPLPECDPPQKIGLVNAKIDTKKNENQNAGEDDNDTIVLEEKEKTGQEAISELAHLCRKPYLEVAKLSENQLVELRHIVMTIMKKRSPTVVLMLGDKDDTTKLQSKLAEKMKENDKEEHILGEGDGMSTEIPIVRIEEGLEVEFLLLRENQENEGEWIKATISNIITSKDKNLQDNDEENKEVSESSDDILYEVAYIDDGIHKVENLVKKTHLRAILVDSIEIGSWVEVSKEGTDSSQWSRAVCVAVDNSLGDSKFSVQIIDGTLACVGIDRLRPFRSMLLAVGEAKPEPDSASESSKDAKKLEDSFLSVPIDRVVWMYETGNGWVPHEKEISEKMEMALRDGRVEIELTVGDRRLSMTLVKSEKAGSDANDGLHQIDEEDNKQRLRRHISGEGLQAVWEMLSLKYTPPLTLNGNSALSQLANVWASGDTLTGETCGLGFLFLYNLLCGSSRVSMIPNRFSYSNSNQNTRNDSHRYAMLLAQLMNEDLKRSLMGSCINILIRNRHICVRMPRFKDTRKMRQSAIFNGWTDSAEPRSNIAELFSKLVPALQKLKQQRGALRYPPQPPYAEMEPKSSAIHFVLQGSSSSSSANHQISKDEMIRSIVVKQRLHALLHDTSRDTSLIAPVTYKEVTGLAKCVQFKFGNSAETLPISIEEVAGFEAVAEVAKTDNKLLVLFFAAEWCGACKIIKPLVRQFSMRLNPLAVFATIDIDEDDEIARRFQVSKLPTIVLLSGGSGSQHEKARIEGGGPEVGAELMKLLYLNSSKENLQHISSKSNILDHASVRSLEVSGGELHDLALNPLANLNHFTTLATRIERGLSPVASRIDALCALQNHKSASTAVAKSMLNRLQKDIALYAQSENEKKEGYIKGFSEDILDQFFVRGKRETMELNKDKLMCLLSKLKLIRDEDLRYMKEILPFLRHASNFIGLEPNNSNGNNNVNYERVIFKLKQICGQVPNISLEFLFGATLSTSWEADVSLLNPYLEKEGNLELIMRLVNISMLRSNRIGHANRCIGMALQLLNLVDLSLAMSIDSPQKRKEACITMKAKITQASTDLAGGLLSQRHFMENMVEDKEQIPYSNIESTACISYDPRFLLFEFIWNILLRKKQVEIVNNFRHNLGQGRSKIKQMIMGAGKTFVVAPLLALCLADGKSLVLSLVPKALLEMNRTIMRETFASIITKRIHTLHFDRSSVVTKSMLQSIEKAKRNRGIIVATPTTLKSFQLVYIETLQRIKETTRCGETTRSKELTLQAKEMANVLQIFKDGVVLLDEVDMVLHPLKSELNFPIGEKQSLDCSDQGQRWGLVIHLLDAIFFISTNRVTSFEQSGSSLGVLKRLLLTIKEGYNQRALQHLPHITLLNPEFYHQQMKPILAEWCYLWLQKQHLHGIEKKEVINYILEGAVARSDLAMKLRMIETSLNELKCKLGQECPEPNLTQGYCTAVSPEHLRQKEESRESLKREISGEIEKLENHDEAELMRAKLNSLSAAKDAVTEEARLMNDIFNAEENLETHMKNVAEQSIVLGQEILSLQKEIEILENPRDTSLDNNTVLWCAPSAFHSSVLDETDDSDNEGEEEEGAVKSLEPESVEGIINSIEQAGFSCKQSSDPDEAIGRARNLLGSKQLRCVIFGGVDRSNGRKKGGSLESKSDFDIFSYFSTELQNGIEGSMGNEEKIPIERLCLYAGNSYVPEETRIAAWKSETTIAENTNSLVGWISSIPDWDEKSNEEVTKENDDVDITKLKQQKLIREKSFGSTRLEECRNNLEKCLEKKKSLEGVNEDEKEVLRKCTITKFQELVIVLQKRLETIEIHIDKTAALPNASDDEICKFTNNPQESGAASGRDAAHAIAWISWFLKYDVNMQKNMKEKPNYKSNLRAACRALQAEKEGLQQVLLAAKIMTFVNSPTHKKLMNLTHDWLRTFLPHCLSKVNRVSFGLLTSEECLAALNEDPLVPRSRLALAVPFMGKDVPSKSAEFAHPDVTIGLTVMAYRYSGMRDGDFSDLMDSIASDFAHEIGPARERPSSLLYESWVEAAGGIVRGVSPQHKVEGDENDDSNEVVQLKFLQQTNKEQMAKLRKMWHCEPLVLHHYLSTFIFPEHMKTQGSKLSASGQSIGGDMLVGRRVGFSGTPSDLLPKELGECDYETGDDGKMLSTVLDPSIMSTEILFDGWTVDLLLKDVATKTPPYQALIDTGALITGFSNVEVAKKLLEHGLPWCEGVVFLDNNDKKQVLVRATGRVVSQEQCGVPLEKRFAFYDQIHTTGTDIKHVVNATAVITLGKDMVFRDYVQGAYRMRQIGKGQGIHVYIIPEVAELLARETSDIKTSDSIGQKHDVPEEILWKIVAWLIINSMRSEQVQWAMLCIQSISNIYQKNAFDVLRQVGKRLSLDDHKDSSRGTARETKLSFDSPLNPISQEPLDHLRPSESMNVFVEPIDFTIDSTVPDPQPFEAKLRSLLDENEAFITSVVGHEVGQEILNEVGKCSNEDGSANKLETEQEREQEQEQQKEVKARKDQQVEIEKFVEREYSRNQEEQKPWPLSILMQTPHSQPYGDNGIEEEETKEEQDFPFYKLNKFKLFSHHGSLAIPSRLMCSRNYFNDKWSGLRRIKNTIMVMEWSPKSATGELMTPEAYILNNIELTEKHKETIKKCFLLLGGNKEGRMGDAGISDTIKEVTDLPVMDGQIPEVISAAFEDCDQKRDSIDLEGFTTLLRAGHLLPSHNDRFYVALSLLEAETILRVLHIRGSEPLLNAKGPESSLYSPEVAIRFSPLSTPGLGSIGDGGIAFGASSGWQTPTSSNIDGIARTGATSAEAASSHSIFRFFDCDMHYSDPQVNVLIRSLQNSSTLDRESFFMSTIGVRRRMDCKWQDTPLAKVFLVEDEYSALKRRAQVCFVRNKLNMMGLKKWEAFVAFDSNDNGHLSPDEIYGALRYLGMPDLSPNDVVDFLEAGDENRDGLLDYKEYLDMLGGEDEDEDEEADNEGKKGESNTSIPKVGAYGTEEMRQVLTERRRAYQEKMHTEQMRRNIQQQVLERKIFEEELTASALRVGGANPKRFIPDAIDEKKTEHSRDCNFSYGAEFTFTSNKPPIRTLVTGGKLEFCGMLHDKVRRIALSGKVPILCPGCSTNLVKMRYKNYYEKCQSCHKYGYSNGGSSVEYKCKHGWSSIHSECHHYYLCGPCFKSKKSDYLEELASIAMKETYARCPVATNLSLLIPPEVIIGNSELWEQLFNVISRLVDSEYGSKLQNKHISKIIVDHFLKERVDDSKKVQHDLKVENSLTHVSILSNSQTKCRLLLCERDMLEGKVKKMLSTILSKNLENNPKELPEILGDSHLPTLHREAAMKSTLFSGTYSDVCFTAIMEFRMPNMPVKNQRTALLRLEPPPVKTGRDSKRQEASIYIQKDGVLAGSQLVERTEGEECIKAGRWHLLTAMVDCISGVLNLYLDGKYVRTVKYSSEIDMPKLRLGSRLILFGGGKQSESQGGEVRLIRLVDGGLTKIQLDNVVTEIQSINPLFRDAATAIQTIGRSILARTRCIALRKSRAKELGLDPDKKLCNLNIKRRKEKSDDNSYGSSDSSSDSDGDY